MVGRETIELVFGHEEAVSFISSGLKMRSAKNSSSALPETTSPPGPARRLRHCNSSACQADTSAAPCELCHQVLQRIAASENPLLFVEQIDRRLLKP